MAKTPTVTIKVIDTEIYRKALAALGRVCGSATIEQAHQVVRDFLEDQRKALARDD